MLYDLRGNVSRWVGQVIPTPLHVLGRISPIFPPFFPVFCAFSPSRRGGSNEPQAGAQGQETVARAPKHRFGGLANSGCWERMAEHHPLPELLPHLQHRAVSQARIRRAPASRETQTLCWRGNSPDCILCVRRSFWTTRWWSSLPRTACAPTTSSAAVRPTVSGRETLGLEAVTKRVGRRLPQPEQDRARRHRHRLPSPPERHASGSLRQVRQGCG